MTALPSHLRNDAAGDAGVPAGNSHAPPPHRDRVRADVVTASDLVRQFGVWQERAARAPVYVMFRGRPRLVLTSIEIMEALVAPHVPDRQVQGPDATALLDLIRDIVIIADVDLRVAAASRTARAYFGESVAPGVSADAVVPLSSRPQLLRALHHVRASGAAQTLDLPSPRGDDRLIAITIEPHRRGVALLVQDITAPETRG